jgi:hypothetical protein
MFSFSIRWIWAQCLAIGAGLLLLAHVAVPGPGNLTLVQGTVEAIGTISRKGLGSFYELRLRTESGNAERVLIGHRDVPQETVQRLIGRTITARVNWSSEAVEFSAAGLSHELSGAHSSASARSSSYSFAGWIAIIIGVLAGAATVAMSRATVRTYFND